MSAKSTALVLAVALVGVIAVAAYAHQRQSSQIHNLKSKNHALRLENAQIAGVVDAFNQFRAQTRAGTRPLQRKVFELSSDLDDSRFQLATVRAQLKANRSQLKATRSQLTATGSQLETTRSQLQSTQAQLSAAEKEAATSGPNAAKSAADKTTKAFCDGLRDLWVDNPGCVTYYRTH